jgi:hypothetical protein
MEAEEGEVMPVEVMPLREWAAHRRALMADEEAERSGELAGARPSIQVAVTERAIRELYARIAGLEARLAAKGK